jgi:hypothetical protein
MARFALLLLALLVAFVTVHAQNNGGAYQDPATGHWFAPDGKAKDGIFIPINFVKAGGVDKDTSNLWVNQVWTDKVRSVRTLFILSFIVSFYQCRIASSISAALFRSISVALDCSISVTCTSLSPVC